MCYTVITKTILTTYIKLNGDMIMKKLLLTLLLATAATSANANFFGGNSGEWKQGPNGPYWDESDWPEWTPMYWMEEFMDVFDDDNGFGGSNFSMPFGGSNNYGMPFGGNNFGQAPYNMPAMPQAPFGYSYPAVPAR